MTPALLTSRSSDPYAAASAAADRDRGQVGEVDHEPLEHGGRHLARGSPLGRLVQLVGVASGEHDAGAGAGELERRVVAEAADADAGDQRGAA